MQLKTIIEKTGVEIVSGDPEGVEIKKGYTCDLLSEVMASGKSDIWITVQSHSNIVAVASITSVKCILLTNGREFNKDTIEKAKTEDIVLLKSKSGSFELSGQIYAMLQG